MSECNREPIIMRRPWHNRVLRQDKNWTETKLRNHNIHITSNLMMECRPPTSLNNYQSSQRNIPEERRFRALSRADQQNKLAPVYVVTTAPHASFRGICLSGGSKESHAVVSC